MVKIIGSLDRSRQSAVCFSADCCWYAFLITFLLVIFSHGELQASMYLCRDKNGKTSFTNAPNGGDCSPHSLQKKKPIRWGSEKRFNGNFAVNGKFDRDIQRVSRRYNVDPNLIKAIIHTESSFNHRAISKSGAQGLMQLMPGTARELRVADPFNPRQNIDGGTRYFRQLLDSFNGNLILTLAAYNAGPGLVKRTGGVPRIPETRRYINKVLKRYKVYKIKGNNGSPG